MFARSDQRRSGTAMTSTLSARSAGAAAYAGPAYAAETAIAVKAPQAAAARRRRTRPPPSVFAADDLDRPEPRIAQRVADDVGSTDDDADHLVGAQSLGRGTVDLVSRDRLDLRPQPVEVVVRQTVHDEVGQPGGH